MGNSDAGEQQRPDQAALAEAVGRRVTALRQGRGLSLSALARAAGLGKGTLSELEAGRRNPTLETLYALSEPLGVGLSGLIADGPGPAAVGLEGVGASTVLLSVVPGVDRYTEVYQLSILPGPQHVSPSHGPGVFEQLAVLQGRVRAGRVAELAEAGPGQTLVWESDAAHSYECLTEDAVVAILIITHPRNG